MHREQQIRRTAIHKKRILVIASSGGHWLQLLRLRPAFENHVCTYVSTISGYAAEVAPAEFFTVRDATRWDKTGLLITAYQVLRIVLRTRPDIVVSTGAAPGLFAILFGRLVGARTIWIDSIANADRLSLSGRLAGYFAHLWLTQWPHLTRQDGPRYVGSVL